MTVSRPMSGGNRRGRAFAVFTHTCGQVEWISAPLFAARAAGRISAPMLVPFRKMHGCGNDFVIFDERAGALGLTPSRAAAIADRHTGVGCDQFIVIENASSGPAADAFMRIRNPDGAEAGACGNATRCVALLLAEETGRNRQIVRTVVGDLTGEVLNDGRVSVDMGAVRFDWRDVPLSSPMDTLRLPMGRDGAVEPAAVSVGNPHATFFVADLAALDVAHLGPIFEHDALFPERANIGFAEIVAPDLVRLRVWERTAGLTRACGSGACAALVNAHRRGLAARQGRVMLDGGELDIAWREDGHVVMTGPVATAFTGMIDLAAFPP